MLNLLKHFHLCVPVALTLSLTGCPPTLEPPQPKTPESQNSSDASKPVEPVITPETTPQGTPANTPPVNPVSQDDQAAVSALETHKVILTKNAAGQVTGINTKDAPINDEQLALVVGFPAIKVLNLENSAVTNDGLKILEKLPTVEEISLRRCVNVDDNGLAELQKLPNLQRLHLLFTLTTNAGLEHVGKLTKLKVLDLRGCMQITDAGLVHLEGLSEMQDLKLRSYGITDEGMKSVAKMHKLRAITLADCSVSSDGVVLFQDLVELRTLNLMRTIAGDDGLRALSKIPLVDLNLRNTATAGYGFEALEAARPTLRILNLSEMRVDNEGVSFLAPFTKLEVLNLWGGSLDDVGVASLAPLVDLRDLNLEDCLAVTSGSAEQLASFSKLQSLNLIGTSIDDAGLEKLSQLTSLKELKLTRSKVTSEGVKNLRDSLSGCKIEF